MLSITVHALPSKVRFAATDWCPYTCDEGEGIVHDYITQLLANHGINSEITYYPWSRAQRMVETGKADALLTAVPSEAPGLLLTNTPTYVLQYCFYKIGNSSWRYRSKASLEEVKLGVVQDYGYPEPLRSHLLEGGAAVSIAGSKATERAVQMLKAGRFDAYVEDNLVVAMNHKSLQQAGCLAPAPFFIALNPQLQGAKELATWLDSVLQFPESRRVLGALLKLYISKYQDE